MLQKSEIIYRGRVRRSRCHSGLWPIAIIYTVLVLQLFGSSMAFTILSPFSYTSLSFKNLLNSVLLSSNANLAGGGRNLKSDVLEDASLITFQDDAGDLHGLAQSTVSRICAKVARALAKHAKNVIKMPSCAEKEAKLAKKFKILRNFPGIIGAIDCTHIKIKKTGGDLAQYYINRKGFYSLNVQVVCDSELKILDIVVRWRGSTHDCRIFNESRVKERFESGEFRGRLLGDSGYKLTPYLFTPLLRPLNDKELKYNVAHIATRNPVERCFGVWKQRFRCLLDGITVSFPNAKILIVALAVLHNIAIQENDYFDTGDIEQDDHEPYAEMQTELLKITC